MKHENRTFRQESAAGLKTEKIHDTRNTRKLIGLISMRVFYLRGETRKNRILQDSVGLLYRSRHVPQDSEISRKTGNIYQEKCMGLEFAENAFEGWIVGIISGSFVIEFLADEFHCAHLLHFEGIPGIAVVIGFVEAADLIPSEKLDSAYVSTVDKGLYDSDGSFVLEFYDFAISYGIANGCIQNISPRIRFSINGMCFYGYHSIKMLISFYETVNCLAFSGGDSPSASGNRCRYSD